VQVFAQIRGFKSLSSPHVAHEMTTFEKQINFTAGIPMKTLVYCINIPCSAAANICILPGLLAGNHHLAECAVACVEDGLYMMQHMDMEMCSVRIHI